MSRSPIYRASSLLSRIEAQFTCRANSHWTAPTNACHKEASMVRRYIVWHNNHAYDERLRIVDQSKRDFMRY